MLQRLLGRVEAGRLGRGLAGLRDGWQLQCLYRSKDGLRGTVSYRGRCGRKSYLVQIRYTGRGARAQCSCPDWETRRQPCMHIAFAAAFELGLAARCRSEHMPVPLIDAGGGQGG